jgi:HSP20 family protein
MLIRNRGKVAPWAVSWGLPDEFNRLWQEFNRPAGWIEQSPAAPAMDVRETPEAFIIEADVPGIKKEEVQIEVADNVVTLKGERWSQREENKKDYHLAERQIGSFRRSVAIPGGFDAGKVSAKFENGVLTITLPKPEEKRPRKIEVRVE